MINIVPDRIVAADIDETELKGELARDYVLRLAIGKSLAVSAQEPGAVVLGSDTAVAVGRRILPKSEDEATARRCLALLSGRSHRVYSGVALARDNEIVSTRVVETRVKVRRLDEAAIVEYLQSGEWDGKAGGYAIQGLFAKHIVSLIGSYTNVVGLPVYETSNLLNGAGIGQ